MRDLVTSALEIVGLVLLSVAVGVALWPVSPALGLAGCGGCLLGASFLLLRGGRA